MARSCLVSVVIKALNEEKNIERTLRSVVAAVQALDAEVILADSLSSDRTVEIASAFPTVTVVQLRNGAERCCGVAAQLGFQHASGEFVLVMDGDMELERDWLHAALARMHDDAEVVGVGGIVDDVNLDNIEFRARQQRRMPDMRAGDVDRLNGGGLYRRSAIEAVGYLTHRTLHACEELELGLRLTQTGGRLVRLDLTSIHHYGHTVSMWTLVRSRWRSRYVDGAGELIRGSLGKPWFWRAMATQPVLVVVLGWWSCLFAVLLGAALLPAWRPALAWVALGVTLLPPGVMVWRKRSLALGLYSILAWFIDTVGFLRGVLRRPGDPRAPIPSVVLQRGRHGA